MNMIVRHEGGSSLAIGAGPSVLGERQVRIPVSGRIRGGIKVLTATAKANRRAIEIYDRGVASGQAYGQIEQQIKTECSMDRSPLTPKNAPYFTVRPSDFSMPEVAGILMDRYAEDRGEGMHLYRLPVILPTDYWQTVLPHALKAYTRSELVYWSEYDASGARRCMTRAQVEVDARAQRARRTFGGRQAVYREDNGGICDPDNCPEYQTRKCTLHGSLIFFVPGVPGTGAIELPTTSFYSLDQMRRTMEIVAYIRGGRISGTMDGQPIFWLNKAQREVSMLDPKNGQAKRVKQWLVELESNIDMSRVFAGAEKPALLAQGQQAAAALTGPSVDYVDESDEISEFDHIKLLRQEVFDLLNNMEIKSSTFADYGVIQWGADWSRQVGTLRQAVAELRSADESNDTVRAYVEKINQTIEELSQ